MNFSLDDDQLALRDAVRRFCDGTYPLHERGNPESATLASQRWQGLAELGLLGMPFAADLGGSEQGATEIMLATYELGRSLGGAGFVPAVVLAGQLLAQAGSPADRERWLPALAEGKARLSFGLSLAEARGDLSRVGVVAQAEGDGYVLEGHKAMVLETDAADLVVVLARTAGADGDTEGLTLFAIDTRLGGVTQTGFSTLDGRRAAQLRLDEVAVSADAVIGVAHQGHALARAAVDRALAAWTSEAVGAIEALYDLTTDYMKTRKQFGAPLAKFQALQHRMADVLMSLETSRSMACAAAMAVDEAPDAERRRIIDAAQVVVGKAGRNAGHAAIQLHGGMGMTDECRVGHYVKRLMVLDQYFGNTTDHLRSLAAAH